MVEFALVVVPLVLVLGVTIDVGRAVFVSHELEMAAREGARYGVNSGRTADQVCARAASALALAEASSLSGCGSAGALSVSVTQRGTAGNAADPVTLSLTYAFRPVTPVAGQAIGTLMLSGTSSMAVEL